MGLGLLQLLQQQADGLVLQREHRRGDDVPQRLIRHAAAHIEVLLVDGAQNMVDGAVVDQQPGVLGLGEQRGYLLLAGGDGQRRQIHPVDQDVLGLLLGKADGVFQQLALVPVDAALLLHLVHQHQQLLLGHLAFAAEAENLVQQLFPQGEQQIQGHQHPDEHPQDGGGQHGAPLRAVLGDALGGYLAEDQHHHRHHHRGDGGARVAVVPHEQHRADGRGSDVDDVVADEDGGQQPVVLLQQLQGQRRVAAPLLRQRFQARGIGGGKGRLRGRKIGGQQQADRHHDDTSRS